MKVFICERNGGLSGGLAVVAANSKEEAFEVFFSNENYSYLAYKYDLETGKQTDDPSKWRSYDYPLENWVECLELTANVEKPCVIIENGYSV